MNRPIQKVQGELYGGNVVLENEYVSLWHHPTHNIVHHQMRQVPTSEAFRGLLTRGAEVVEQKRAKKWLSDDTKNTIVREADADWANGEWFPRVARAGFQFWAIVLPMAAIGKLNMRRFASEYQRRGITVDVVDDPQKAFDWLSAQ